MKLLNFRLSNISMLLAATLFFIYFEGFVMVLADSIKLTDSRNRSSGGTRNTTNIKELSKRKSETVRNQRIGVILSDDNLNATVVKKGFIKFLEMFHLNIDGAKVDFISDEGLSGFVKRLQDNKYTTIINVIENNTTLLEDGSGIGYCHLTEGLSKNFNKTVVSWPCPSMMISDNFLPSFEAISFAIKSIAKKLNWTQVVILVADSNWGLPLAIAANLHIPFHLQLDTIHLDDLKLVDKTGKAIIISSPLKSQVTLNILHQLENLNHTKILLVDIVAASLNKKNNFYRKLSKSINPSSRLMMNLLILTVLSDKYRHFISIAFQEMEIDFLPGFRRQRPWHYPEFNINNNSYITTTNLSSLLDSIQMNPNCYHDFNLAKSFLNGSNEWWCNNFVERILTCAAPTVNTEKQRLTMEKIRNECQKGIRQVKKGDTSNSSVVMDSVKTLKGLLDFFYLFDFIVSKANNNGSKDMQNKPEYDFIVLDIQGISGDNQSIWRPFLILEQNEINLSIYTSHPILPGYNDWLLDGTTTLWHCNTLCWIIIGVCIMILMCIVGASVAAGIAVRNYLLRKRLSKGPNKIVLSVEDFVFPVDTRRVDEGIEAMLCCWLQQLQEFGGPEVDKPDLLKGSIGSLKNLGLTAGSGGGGGGGGGTGANKTNSGSGSLARHNATFLDMRARYNGDMVQLKEIQFNGGSVELKAKAMDLLVMAHGLRHENINPLIGWLSDPGRSAMVFDYCSRGSLQDVLIMDEIKLDWSFRLSLLTDLVRGMRYLHSSPIRVHGALSSRNCVVDARWVLKITDYCIPAFYEIQGLTQPSKSAKELLWTAPELLRNNKGNTKCGTQMGDVYSFGIIMQEVVVRGEPYCMLSLSPEEIIAKIKKPPPLIRPSVSKGAAPPEAINIMRQCWAELPDMRPDFNSVYERFKLLNHGRKVNFVDTMFQMLEKYSNNLEELIRERTEQLDIERKKTEQLLNRMLPSSVAEKLKMGLAVDPEEFADVTIYFSDIVGFTTIAAHCSPVQVVDLLNDLYTIFDATINAYNVYKVETIGDAYMVVSGLPVRIPDHAEQIATMALDLLHQSGRFKVKHLPGVPLQLRIGLHTGPCCAGVVGLTMPRYCLFGDTVNTASRMESTGSSWRIHMSEVTRDRLENAGGYNIDPRGPIEIKGKGLMNTYWLLGKKGFDKPLPTPPPIGESHGLDESLIRNSIIMKAQSNKSRNSTNPSSSQSSSLAGESVEVKVEITPPTNIETHINLPNSYSLDSNTNLSPNFNIMTEFPTKTPSASPQQRKLSELSPDGLLNPGNFNRLNPASAGGSSSRLYKRIEEMMDLSSPYNHYKCLSPSESNLSQFADGKYLYGLGKMDSKPGSSRLLRRQFSLDKDDGPQHHQSIQLQSKQTLDIPILHDSRCSPKGQLPRLHKQNSTSIAQDLEKIEEIPMSPASSLHHSSLDSSLNRSPPTGPGPGILREASKETSSSSPSEHNKALHSKEIQLNVEALMTR